MKKKKKGGVWCQSLRERHCREGDKEGGKRTKIHLEDERGYVIP